MIVLIRWCSWLEESAMSDGDDGGGDGDRCIAEKV